MTQSIKSSILWKSACSHGNTPVNSIEPPTIVSPLRALAMQPSLLVLDMIEGELDDESKAWWSSKISQMITTPSLLAHSAFILGAASALPSVREFCHLARLKIDSLSIIAQ